MLKSPKSLLIGTLISAGGVALSAATLGAVTPRLFAIGATLGAAQVGKTPTLPHRFALTARLWSEDLV